VSVAAADGLVRTSKRARSVVDAVATGLFNRLGPWYLVALAGASFVVASLFAAFDTAILQLYRNVGTRDFGLLLALGEGVNAVGLALGFVLFALRRLVRLGRWLQADGGPAVARLIADEAAALPGRIVPPIALVIMVLEVPTILLTRDTLHLDVSLIVVLLAVLAPNATAAYFIFLILEQLLRPVVRHAAAQLDANDQSPPPTTLTLRQKLLFGLPIVNFMTAYVTAAFVERANTLTGRMTLGVAAALAVTLTVSMVLTTTLVHAFNEPVKQLMAATARVGRGDLSVVVPALANDELGQLAEQFNQMIGGLQQRAKLQSALGAYIDPTIAERVAKQGGQIAGQAADVTVMFVDIIGFTKFAENAAPEHVVASLNEFFEVVIPPIERHGGHANKLLGDGLMAVFGVPRPLPDHADRALMAALEIASGLATRFTGQLRAGIGVNSGTVVVGSMGGGGKLDYTIIGDVVNVAARVEAYTRHTGDTILLTDATRARLTHDAHLTARGTQPMKGRDAPVALWARA
jgi:class 3 adenylate cyclase